MSDCQYLYILLSLQVENMRNLRNIVGDINWSSGLQVSFSYGQNQLM